MSTAITWDDLVAATLAAAGQAVDLVTSDDVAAAWDEPSALPDMTVGALAVHVAQMLSGPVAWLEADPTATADRSLASLGEIYGMARLDPDVGLDGDVARTIRGWARDGASAGPAAVAAGARASLDRLGHLLPAADQDRLIPSVFAEGRGMELLDYVRTRCIEFIVHSDDLAASVGIDAPAPPPVAAEAAIGALVELCRQRAGDAEVIRALSRVERADPNTLRAV